MLVVGDSLSAGYGIAADEAWPTLLEQRGGGEYILTNASVSGETTAGGRSRLPALLARHRPDLVVLALGANDGLRGLPLKQMHDNLDAMIRAISATGAHILLIGIRLPPNYGSYASAFERVFVGLAKHHRITLMPFLLEGFADQPDFFQADGLHPTAAAQTLIVERVEPLVRKALK